MLNETHFYVFPTIPITFPHNREPLRFFLCNLPEFLYTIAKRYVFLHFTQKVVGILNVLNVFHLIYLGELVITIHRESPPFCSCMLFHCIEGSQFNQSPSDISINII